ncbi:hypothetical protein [Granulosicoccus antarcticus]|uniref:BIG2 domain-containing protein n=1 Tax=Granulosicoccus antarcticus IMCC3135 TaxID=1192854 RepID=A0A2Z2P4C0_9GAMM|nr:hypothetical protein [Granulosicoccus antarcticus]ASJ75517.1 hypothetical protein IMCC3135_27310 [Granulosicoccus antarcticus IMCC3135]
MRTFKLASAAVLALIVAGCDGNARPFEEAVEVRTENLTSIEVVPPTITVPALFMNIGDTAQFGVQGNTVIGQVLTLDSDDRQWQVTDESVASIDGNGLLTAKANGIVGVFVSIGGLETIQYDLTVSQADLIDVSEVIGEAIIERCLPQEYSATGLFDDGSTRDLSEVSWSLAAADSSNARIQNNPDITAEVTGLNASSITLTAALSGFTLPLPLEISDSLTALDISPDSVSLSVDGTQTLAAFGTYEGAAPGSTDTTTQRTSVNVSSAVDWQITNGGEDVASVSNTTGSKGLVTGLESGVANLTVSCGVDRVSDAVVVTISDSSSDELSFERGSSISVDVDAASFTLNVSSGSSYSSDDILDNDDLTWEFDSSSSTSDAISLDGTGDDAGEVDPLRVGSGTITVTDSDGNSETIFIEVTDN